MTRPRAAAILASAAALLACGPTVLKPHLYPPAAIPAHGHDNDELLAHLRSGDLIVFSTWSIAKDRGALEGTGTRYSPRREAQGTGPQSVSLEDLALVETNDRKSVSTLAMIGLGTLTTVWGAVSVICIADPKSCFGSCPTFYAEDDLERPRAEGFSASVARVLEARDVDALGAVRPKDGRLAIEMRNEAQETHAVRRVRLLTVARPAGGRVFATADGQFRPVGRIVAPAGCRAPEGDCRDAVARDDGTERLSEADPEDLAAREEIELTFPERPAEAGLVLRARQSLLTTFLFYQTLAYMGRDAGRWLAAAERAGRSEAERMMGMARVLGGIEVAVAGEDGAWRGIGTFDEAGPIAGDTWVMALPPDVPPGPIRARLRMAKGHWRVDWVGLGALGPAAVPTVVPPVLVERRGRPDPEALTALRGGGRHLVTLPGDQYRISFPLAGDGSTSEVFLESEGYYYEWMRADWLAEEDPAMVALVVGRPEEALRRLAGPFKAQEARADRTFWNSRFGK